MAPLPVTGGDSVALAGLIQAARRRTGGCSPTRGSALARRGSTSKRLCSAKPRQRIGDVESMRLTASDDLRRVHIEPRRKDRDGIEHHAIRRRQQSVAPSDRFTQRTVAVLFAIASTYASTYTSTYVSTRADAEPSKRMRRSRPAIRPSSPSARQRAAASSIASAMPSSETQSSPRAAGRAAPEPPRREPVRRTGQPRRRHGSPSTSPAPGTAIQTARATVYGWWQRSTASGRRRANATRHRARHRSHARSCRSRITASLSASAAARASASDPPSGAATPTAAA